MKHLSVIQHTQSEWLGHIEDHLEGRGIRFGYHRPFTTGGSIPAIETIGDGLILLGGGNWGAASKDHQLPTLEQEVRLTRACLMLGKPVIGIGLGSQILALAAEGRVAECDLTLSVGTASRVREGALAGRLPERFPFVTFMRDRPVPPAYADILAVDQAGAPALYQVGGNAFGFSGHPGLRPAMIEDLVMEIDDAPPESATVLPAITAAARQIEDVLVPIMAGIIELTGWMRP